ncbi:MAG: GlsB/YeaQ/YmgE family stress response membrane protein [Chloroflexi bacterium]|nr:GlsB/YeaQ/YmgE family stress response membrane protein [Chloroflexota bacterium]
MGIIAWIVVGLIAGWLADMVMGGGSRLSLGDLVLGVVGALVGGFLASTLFNVADPVSGINLTTLIVAFIGAVIVVGIVRALSGRRSVV